MNTQDRIIKRCSLYFPNMSIPCITKSDNKYIVHIFGVTLNINCMEELEYFVNCIINRVQSNVNKDINDRKCTTSGSTKTTGKGYIHKDDTYLTKCKDTTRTAQKCNENRSTSGNNNDSKHKNNEYMNSGTTNITNSTKHKSVQHDGTTNSTKRHKKNTETRNNVSAKSKMKIKNIKDNKYTPAYIEDTCTKNNILVGTKESFSHIVGRYCIDKNIAHPEFLFEKSNGVYICRAFFMNEKFESRYAYDISVAKEDTSRLIYSYIQYKNKEECIKSSKGERNDSDKDERNGTSKEEIIMSVNGKKTNRDNGKSKGKCNRSNSGFVKKKKSVSIDRSRNRKESKTGNRLKHHKEGGKYKSKEGCIAEKNEFCKNKEHLANIDELFAWEY